jgi:hypothetical protein
MSLIEGLEYKSIESKLKLKKGSVKKRVRAFSESFLSFAASVIPVDTNNQSASIQSGAVE